MQPPEMIRSAAAKTPSKRLADDAFATGGTTSQDLHYVDGKPSGGPRQFVRTPLACGKANGRDAHLRGQACNRVKFPLTEVFHMRQHSIVSVALLVWLMIGLPFAKGQAPTASVDKGAIEKQIRANAEAFVQSFAKRDAAALAAQWTPDGVYIDEEGTRFEGRGAIQAEYEQLFKACPTNLRLRLEVDTVQVLNENTALEEGRSAMTPQAPGEPRIMSRYTVIHVKQDGNWLMANVRDNPIELPPEAGNLEDLAWLVGNWSAVNKGVATEVTCRWVENKQFLLRTQSVTESDQPNFTGLEVIGRDPANGRITSWMFTSDGGHAVGVWTPLEGSWIVTTTGMMADGTPTNALYVYTRTKDDALMWKSEERMIGDATIPDLPPITLRRKS